MATAHLLRRDFQPNYGLHRSTVSELWHVTGVSGWTPDNTTSAIYASIPRVLGQSHPDIGQAICTNFSLREMVSTSDAIVAVFFQTNHSEVFRVRASTTRGFTTTIEAPNWSNSLGAWAKTTTSIPREVRRRIETRYLRNGSLSDEVRESMFNLVGTIVRFPDTINGVPHLMRTPSIVDYAPGQSRLVYTFDSLCRVRALPAGTLVGQNIALPALGYMEEWFSPAGVQADGTPYPIQIWRWQDRYDLTLQTTVPYLV